MTGLLLLALAFGLGVAFAVYLPMQSLAATRMGSPMLANVAFFGFGLVTAIAVAVAAGARAGDLARFAAPPWWTYAAGVMSGLMILGSSFLIPRVGPAAFFVLFVAGQVVAGTVIGHRGWLGAAPDPASLKVVAGVAMVVAGAWLVTHR